MATDLERLVVSLSADIKKFENAMARASGAANSKAKAIETRFQRMNSNINRSFQDSLKGAVALAGTAISAREIQQYADAWTEAGNKIAAAAQSSGVQARSLGELRQGADGARVSLGDYVDLYAKLIRSASGVAKSEQEIATATDIVSKAFKAGGAGAQEQAAGILQLGQALGSGVLQGDELRSLRENAPLIAKAIADEFKTTIAGLKQLGADGKLTSDRVFKAILNAQKPIEAQFNATNATIADGFTKLKNAVTEYVGQQAQAYGVTTAINTVLAALAGNVDSVAAAAAAAAIALTAAFAGPAIIAGAAALLNPFVLMAAAIGAAAYAFTEFYDTIVPLQGSFATLGDYATALWQIIGDGADAARAAIVGAFDTVLSSINSALSGVGLSMDDVWSAVKSGVNAIINSFVSLKDVVVATFETVPSAIGDAVLSAMNAMISGVETGINKVISAVNSAIGAINSLGSYAGAAALPVIDTVSLGRLENSYAGAGERASKAFQDAVNRQPTDYLGAAGSAVAGAVDTAVTRITARANEVAAARRELERETNRATVATNGGVSTPAGNTKGFGGGSGAAPDSGSGKKKKQSDYAREIEQIKERTAALQAETAAQALVNPLVDDYGFASERASAAHDLLTAAQKSGLAAGKELKDVTQLLSGNFEGLSPAAREQAEAMLGLANGYATASAEAEKLAEKQANIRQAADDFKSTAKSTLSGFISDMRQGKSAAEALEGALDKVIDKLIDVALNSAFDSKSGGGLGGIISSLFGGGASSSFPTVPGIGLYSEGGYTGNGGKFQPAGVVHKGEYVMDAESTKRIGVDNLRKLQGYAAGGYVGSAPSLPSLGGSRARDQQHVDVRISVDKDGNLKAFVQRESAQVSATVVQATAPAIVNQSVNASGSALSKGKFDYGMSKYGQKRSANVG